MLVPAVVWVAAVRDAAERRRRLRLIAIGGAVAAVLVAPYLIRCAITFGDPLYAINYHTGFSSSICPSTAPCSSRTL
jgi:hypothetical protein